ncbi:MAG: hemerythrin family protein, partial [bacterium]|nr:hemerythrin family protein [bacterium]
MALFNWKDEYSVNVKEIDKQHQMLVDSLNELFEAMRSGEAKEIIGGILKGLVDYAGVHFSYEEKLLNRYNYPEYAKHKTEHDAFVEKTVEFQEKYNQGKLMLSMEVMNFLKDWLKNHILGTDKKYSSFFNERGI